MVDVACFRHAALKLPKLKELQTSWSRTFSIPFNSKSKWMLTINTDLHGNSFLYCKGAPDVLVQYCSSHMKSDGSSTPFEKDAVTSFEKKQNTWSSEGQRVIMTCYKTIITNNIPLNDDKAMETFIGQEMKDMIIMALVGIRDPPRGDVPLAVKQMRDAGLRVFMVTGDFLLTAESIAKQCGIITASAVARFSDLQKPGAMVDYHPKSVHDMKPDLTLDPKAIVLTGTDVSQMTQELWDEVYSNYAEIVFARTSPEMKMVIVEECKSRGDSVVGVTGDGVNDAPALRAADIGMAMGAGSEVAKEAATMILLNNDFASIPVAIENGRLVFENLRKVLSYLILGRYVRDAIWIIH